MATGPFEQKRSSFHITHPSNMEKRQEVSEIRSGKARGGWHLEQQLQSLGYNQLGKTLHPSISSDHFNFLSECTTLVQCPLHLTISNMTCGIYKGV